MTASGRSARRCSTANVRKAQSPTQVGPPRVKLRSLGWLGAVGSSGGPGAQRPGRAGRPTSFLYPRSRGNRFRPAASAPLSRATGSGFPAPSRVSRLAPAADHGLARHRVAGRRGFRDPRVATRTSAEFARAGIRVARPTPQQAPNSIGDPFACQASWFRLHPGRPVTATRARARGEARERRVRPERGYARAVSTGASQGGSRSEARSWSRPCAWRRTSAWGSRSSTACTAR